MYMLLSERPIHSSADTPGTSLVFPLPCETDLYRVSSLGTTPDGSDVWCWGHAAADMPAAVAVVAAAAKIKPASFIFMSVGLLRLASVGHRDWTHIITTITGNSIALGVFEASRRLGRRLLR